MEQCQKILQCDDINDRERNQSQHIVMLVVSDYIVGVGNNGTINKFMIIRVGSNEPKMIVRRYQFNILAFDYSVKNILCCVFTSKPLEDFCIFFQNLIGNAQSISPLRIESHTGK